jgi:hypothetical protein
MSQAALKKVGADLALLERRQVDAIGAARQEGVRGWSSERAKPLCDAAEIFGGLTSSP